MCVSRYLQSNRSLIHFNYIISYVWRGPLHNCIKIKDGLLTQKLLKGFALTQQQGLENKMMAFKVELSFVLYPVFQLGWEKGRVQKKLGTNNQNSGTIYCANDTKSGTV